MTPTFDALNAEIIEALRDVAAWARHLDGPKNPPWFTASARGWNLSVVLWTDEEEGRRCVAGTAVKRNLIVNLSDPKVQAAALEATKGLLR